MDEAIERTMGTADRTIAFSGLAVALSPCVVVGGFAASGITFMKMAGVGLVIAVVVDVTIVRVLLLPAGTRLLGRWAWWAPAPLTRLWERSGGHGG